MDKMPKVAILLSTYNGENYLAPQLDSILNQSYKNFVVVVRDDGSDDSTVQQLAEYQAIHPAYFHVLEQRGENLGASTSFACLIKYVLDNKDRLELEHAYMMFCDQDDVWFKEKIAVEMQLMLEREKVFDGNPVLVHSDLTVVSEAGEKIAQSFIEYQGLGIHRNRFPQLVLCNLVTGCTALLNEALAAKSLPMDEKAIMHDWWIALVASAFGEIAYLSEPLVHYRQHNRNAIGAKEYIKPRPLGDTLVKKLFGRSADPHLHEVAAQASAFSNVYGQELDGRQKLALVLVGRLKTQYALLQNVLCRVVRVALSLIA